MLSEDECVIEILEQMLVCFHSWISLTVYVLSVMSLVKADGRPEPVLAGPDSSSVLNPVIISVSQTNCCFPQKETEVKL